MARNHARIVTAVWQDEDFCALPVASQHLYLACVSAPRLSYAGVLDYLPSRLAMIAADLTPARIEKAAAPLLAGRYILIDRDTSELLVRSYVRHDGLLTQPNVTKAMVKDWRLIVSPNLRDAVRFELRRLYAEDPTPKGWKEGVGKEDPELFQYLQAEPFPEPFGEPFREPFPVGVA